MIYFFFAIFLSYSYLKTDPNEIETKFDFILTVKKKTSIS